MNDITATLPAEHLSTNALKVISRLQESGYQAYLVGGCVRDLLLGYSPKDFDVATDAHPEEVHELFRNSRLIGRRFRIVHVRFGREIIEVSTFRGRHREEDEGSSGMVRDDNVYGTFEEDVFRRDFAMNALYCAGVDQPIVDLVDGVSDIREQRIRLIGEPDQRFREDPVRMLRAIRFKAKLDFSIEPHCEAAIRDLGYLVQDVAPARMFEEVLKLFMNGDGVRCFELAMEYELFGWLFPSSRRAMDNEPRAEVLVREALASTDRRIKEDLPVTPAFIFAAFLWYPFVAEMERLESEENQPNVEAVRLAATNILVNQQIFTSIPRRFSGPIREIWSLQFRLPMRYGKKPDVLMEHKRFRAAYDFLLMRELAGEQTDGLGDWWTRYQEASEAERPGMKQESGAPRNKRRRKRKRRPNQAKID